MLEQFPGDQALVLRFKDLTEKVLPARAREEKWPIRFDHCFKRICLDHAFGDVWYKHLARPAEKHLVGEALKRATTCAEELANADARLLRERDAASLQYRGKRPKGERVPQGKLRPGSQAASSHEENSA